MSRARRHSLKGRPEKTGAIASHGAYRGQAFAHFANGVAHAAGRPIIFALACVIIVAWAALGPVFGFSDTWQLIINTGTTIVTFLMVFLIQNTQNRDGAAVQAKLDELIRVTRSAHNVLIRSENLPEEELEQIRDECDEDGEDESPDERPAVANPRNLP